MKKRRTVLAFQGKAKTVFAALAAMARAHPSLTLGEM
ncbi:hypothetical protein LCGC14_1350980 [marine sediment metagenome]|uniref:Uncharacterized protein n=1 Tax=marine sediment metagenome TaxID=412755 RepID=A0A0F9KX49_9ZZZZ